MTVSEQQRLDLYEEMKGLLEPSGLTTFMELLPRTSSDDLATRNDLAAQGIALRGEMAELRAELKGEMAELRADIDLRFAQQTRSLLIAMGGFAVSTWFTVFAAAAI